MKHHITLATILPDVRYTQLALYDLKAYALTYSAYRTELEIRLCELEADRHQYLLGTTYPVLSRQSLIRHAARLLADNPRVIGFSTFMWNIEFTLRLARIIKTIRPATVIILGGPEASSDPKKFLSGNRAVDMVVRDEGEATFTETLDAILSGNNDLAGIKGLFYRKGKRIIENEYRPPLDLSVVPSPYLMGLIDLDADMSFALETSRGCPFRCAYCTYSIRGYHQLRFFPLEKILGEVKLVMAKRPRKIRIMDDNFNINPVRTAAILEALVRTRHKADIKVFLNSSMWEVDDRLVTLLKKSDITASVGVQSVNERVLKLISRGNKRPVLEKNLEKFDRAGLKYELSFIMGLPGENYENIHNSLDWAFRFHPQEINLFPLMIFKGTYLARHAKRLGLTAYGKPFYLIRKNRTLPERMVKKGIALREAVGLLYNKGLLRQTLRHLAAALDLPFTEIMEEFSQILTESRREMKPLALQKYLVKEFIGRYPALKKTRITGAADEDFRLFSGQGGEE